MAAPEDWATRFSKKTKEIVKDARSDALRKRELDIKKLELENKARLVRSNRRTLFDVQAGTGRTLFSQR